MRGLALAALVVLTLGAATARADSAVPAGFTLDAPFSAAASFVAGKPDSVYCAPTQAAIVAVSAGEVPDVLGVTPTVGGTVIFLAPKVCVLLHQWEAGKKPSNLYGVAVSIETVAHEAEHTTGIRDETDADCAALKVMPAVALKFFPTRGRETLHRMMADAWKSHTTAPRIYRAHAC